MKLMIKNKRLFIYILSLSLIVFSLSVILLCLTMKKNHIKHTEAVNISQSSMNAASPNHYTYKLQEYQGKVAVFNYGKDDQPLEIFNIDTYMLPESDQKDLQKGIPISDDNALKKIIEDFDG